MYETSRFTSRIMKYNDLWFDGQLALVSQCEQLMVSGDTDSPQAQAVSNQLADCINTDGSCLIRQLCVSFWNVILVKRGTAAIVDILKNMVVPM